MKQHHKGLILGVLGVFFYSLTLIFMKLTSDLPPEVVAFFRIIGLFFVILPFVVKDPSYLKTRRFDLHLVRIISFLVTNFILLYAFHHIYLINISLLTSITPLVIPLISLLFFGKKITLHKQITILLGFLGATLVLNQGLGSFSTSNFFFIIIPITTALSLSAINKLAETDRMITILFYYSGFSSLIAFILMLPKIGLIPINTWPYLLLITLFSTLFQIFITKAYSISDPQLVCPVTYFDVIFCALFGWLIWNERLNFSIIFGSLLIVFSGLYIIFEERILSYTNSEKKKQ